MDADHEAWLIACLSYLGYSEVTKAGEDFLIFFNPFTRGVIGFDKLDAAGSDLHGQFDRAKFTSDQVHAAIVATKPASHPYWTAADF